jgi:hypothetical protein
VPDNFSLFQGDYFLSDASNYLSTSQLLTKFKGQEVQGVYGLGGNDTLIINTAFLNSPTSLNGVMETTR